jgi:MFS family permease
LGSSEALASLIIGMTPVAALVSTLLYSWWTNHSYKAALIFASICSAIGNLLYAAGLPAHSLILVMLGRLWNGFGSARSINRRYIADTFGRSERTAASAAFVTAGALGMAAGPAIASLLHLLAQDSVSLYFQVENAPGWFMFGVWTIYLTCLILFFEDPPRKHQEEKASAVVEMTTNEAKPLLGNGGDNRIIGDVEPPLWKNVAVMTTFHVYFVLKLVLECVLSSSSILTDFYFDWSGTFSGIYLAILGLLMLPANFVVAHLARVYDDRELVIGFQVIMTLGCIVILQFGRYSPAQYIAGSVILFLSTNALEGPNMSLLSQTIPKSWSKGILNVGLLATEAGTLGRAVGDVYLTACGSNGMEHMLNNTFGSMGVLSFVTLLVSLYFYDSLRPIDKDD